MNGTHTGRVSALATALLLAAALAAPPLDAQSAGFQGGLSLADLIGDAVRQSDTRQGLNAGGALTLLRYGPLSIGPEVYYAQKGADAARLEAESPAMFEQFGLDYLEIPLLAKLGFQVPGVRWLRAYAQGGPAFAWKLSCHIEPADAGEAAVNDECALNQNQDAQTLVDDADRGLVFGGGLDLNVMNRGTITLDGRHVRGLARLAQERAPLPEVRNQATSFMVGYSFGLE